MSIGTGTAIAGGGLLSGIGSIFGSSQQAAASQQAAQLQYQAAQQALQLQRDMFNQTTQNLSPWLQAGQSALQKLTPMVLGGGISTLPSTWGMTQFTPTMDSLARTPGYQFTLSQGLQSTKNAYAASGLAGSVSGRQAQPSGPLGAALTQYGTGLAGTTFNQNYQNWLAGQTLQMQQNQQTYNMFGGISGSGQNAGANLGSLGLQAATTGGNLITGGAAASAGGLIGAANANAAGIAGATGGISQAALGYALNQGGFFGQPSTMQFPGGTQAQDVGSYYMSNPNVMIGGTP